MDFFFVRKLTNWKWYSLITVYEAEFMYKIAQILINFRLRKLAKFFILLGLESPVLEDWCPEWDPASQKGAQQEEPAAQECQSCDRFKLCSHETATATWSGGRYATRTDRGHAYAGGQEERADGGGKPGHEFRHQDLQFINVPQPLRIRRQRSNWFRVQR